MTRLPRTRRAPLACLAGLAAILATGCEGGALDGRSDEADRVATLFWVLLGLSALPMAAVIVLIAIALVRRRAGHSPAPGRRLTDHRFIVVGGIILPALILIPTIAVTLATSRADAGTDDGALEIEVTGHRWWWDLRYPAPGEHRLAEPGSFRTANEVHVPAGRPVVLRLRSDDVIHSFWVPQLGGKIDLIPGRTNSHRITVTEPGVYRGQCAEFCGASHALMKLVVVAHSEEDFEEWRRREAAPVAAQPDTDLRETLADSCAACHTFRGVYESGSFHGRVGPDLTHLAARRMIGANLLPNTREALGRWIVDPQGVKPDNLMPDVGLDGQTLADVVDYLERLE